jgi:arginyl-tRNA synthetase
VLYVVSNEQALHFEQLFLAANKLGWIKKDQEFVHIKFGLMRGEDLKRLSTRKGKTILLEEVIKEAIRRARKIVEKKNPSLSAREKKKISRVVGIGALKYNDLSQNRNTDIVFNWGKILDFEGNSAPYLQYTYARLRSILRKIENRKLKIGIKDLALLEHPEELGLLKKVLQFQGVLEDAAKENLPNLLCNYLWELANLANTFYEKYPVLKAEADLRNSRLALIDGTSRVLKQGLLVLGIEAPERI